MNAIELNKVNYSDHNFQLKNVSFEVPRGFVTGFIGANGAGKTTVIRLIMDLMQCDSGSISILGDSMINNPIDLKNKIGFVYSETYFNEKWSIKKLESIISPFYKKWDKDLFQHYLHKFELPYKQKINQFSTGMKMKLSLAIAFSHHSEIFVLDEPTSGLDPIVRNEVLEIIQQELIDEEKTVFISTHIISDLEKIADYLVYIRDGEIILNDSLEDLINQFKIVKGFNEDLDNELEDLLIYKESRRTGYKALTQYASIFKELFGSQIEIQNPSIEELMIYLEKYKSNSTHAFTKESEAIK
ncbi:ABC transporter ATP-binding protein [Staphylococcus pasteuri]|uniref:phenol-soluble modulin export ABC transporter ATP-binding protein PmtA n=2 Tax=Staphylococcus TaxID=1279 RepID=UPI000D3A7034|nr:MULTISPECIES: ABC transporter ATP-binding protein [Staphylococcus]MBM6507761.1 ABC transporter ATP-binding protein [Staphylococcus pasteuri]MCO0862307.1 ABC transporter ATP-binding protein [Staphylococcus pasteuri]PTU86314.1 sodium ABC transporter ATP-binding protein [Staphylococcus pasteuri]QQT20498.1 ABC transporter ATP-binding protein [Staphylococcus pasteuri]RFD72016.1 sodium ABC transporter ATP-binding protein [Staphylococcus pasteuri]